MTSLQSFKVHRIVEWLHQCPDFHADLPDLEEVGLRGILAGFGPFPALTPPEEALLERELRAICFHNEIAEVARVCEQSAVVI